MFFVLQSATVKAQNTRLLKSRELKRVDNMENDAFETDPVTENEAMETKRRSTCSI